MKHETISMNQLASKFSPSNIVALLALTLTAFAPTVSCSASAAEPAPALVVTTSPVKVVARARTSYLPGLPIRVTVEVTNTSTQPFETIPPSLRFDALYAAVRHEGNKEDLVPTRWQHHVFLDYPTIQIKPDETVRNQLDISLQFQDDLPPGRYNCTVHCAVGKRLGIMQSVKSQPFVFVIEEPKLADRDYQRDLHLPMTMFLGARVLVIESNKESEAIAQQLFSYIASTDTNGEYGKVSLYYKALLERDPKRALAAWNACLRITDVDAPEMMGVNDIWLNIGRLQYEIGDLKAAKEALSKADKSEWGTHYYLKKIEAGAVPIVR
jgi:hypothetical protein